MIGLYRHCLLALTVLGLTACNSTSTVLPAHGLAKIEHIVVIFAENRSFDNLYGLFPGANGLANATNTTQTDNDGKPLPVLPKVWPASGAYATGTYPVFPDILPNRPFQIDAPPINLPLSVKTRDLVHNFYQQQEQIDGGKMDRYAAVSDAGGLTMGYYDGSKMAMWQWARDYTLADNFFMSGFGGSYFNHIRLICACQAVFPDAPANMRAQVDERGRLLRKPDSPASPLNGPPQFFDGSVTPDGFAINTIQPPYQPSKIPPAADGDRRLADPAKFPLPPQIQKTVGDTLSAKHVSWAWYAGGWNLALTDGMQSPETKRSVIGTGEVNFQTHHQPFNFFANYAPGTQTRAEHLKDYEDLLAGLKVGKLPQVVFYKPQGSLNEHAGYADVYSGDRHIAEVVAKIKASPLWPSTAIIVTYDDNGGFYDHVPPPIGDRWGPGNRLPLLVISSFAKKGFVDHTYYDTTSILKLITRRFDLEPLPGIRPGIGDLTAAFDLAQ